MAGLIKVIRFWSILLRGLLNLSCHSIGQILLYHGLSRSIAISSDSVLIFGKVGWNKNVTGKNGLASFKNLIDFVFNGKIIKKEKGRVFR